MNDVYIASTGSYAPENIVTNDDLSKIVETSHQWITSRSGINERRISSGENTSDLAYKAALNALKDSDVKAEDLDLIILATTSPDSLTPSTACIVQKYLGADKAVCFDINAACTGFIYALEVANNMLKVGSYKNALVIGSEVLSKIVNWEDRSTCVLFGDGAGAVLLKTGKEGIISSALGSEGKKGDVLTGKKMPVLNPYSNISYEKLDKSDEYIKMDGSEVFKFAVNIIPNTINTLLSKTNYRVEDIDIYVPHQANIRIISAAAKSMDISLDKFYVNLDKYGNTSSASIAIAIDEANRSNKFNQGDLAILMGFGGGLTFGSILIKWQI